MIVRWLPKAQANLEAELLYIAAEDAESAKCIALLVKARTEQLSQFPESGRMGRVLGTRELVIPQLPYILPYRIKNGVVEILRFFHTAQKLPAKWL